MRSYRFDKGERMRLSPRELSDRLEIEDLLTRYCYAVDDRDWDAYRRVFVSGAEIDDTVTGGVKSGVEEHIAYLKQALSKIIMSQHAISTVLMEIKEDKATVRAVCSCPMVVNVGKGSTEVFFQGLWYRNQLVRSPGGWRIKQLIEEGYWRHNAPPGFKF
jgi:SnoaL-like domain